MAKAKKQRIAKQKKKASPCEELIFALNSFLIDLDCASEVFEIADPVLGKRDQERHQQMKDFFARVEGAKGNKEQQAEIFSQGFPKILAAIRKIGRGHLLFRSNTFIALVSRFDEFIGEIIRSIHKAHPDRLKSSDKTLSYDELIRLSNINQAVNCLIDKEADKVLRDSHGEQIQYIEKKLNCKLRESLTNWPSFIELTERRNILVHCGGVVSPQYLKVCRSNNVPVPTECKEGKHLTVDQKYFEKAHGALYEVGLKLGQSVLRKIFPSQLKEIDVSFNNLGVELLSEERWQLAKILFAYATSLPPEEVTDDEMRKIFLINHVIALKFSGDRKGYKALLAKEDWSSASSKFALAVHVLRDEYSEAEKIMSSMDGKNPIDEEGFRTWPLFRDFRKTEEFQKAYKTIYKKDFDQLDTARKMQEQVKKEVAGSEATPEKPKGTTI